MNSIETRAIISASDKTGGVFDAIARKISALNQKAAAARRRVSTATDRAETVERAAPIARRHIGTVAAQTARQTIGTGVGLLGPVAVAAGGVQALKRYGETDLALTRIGITAAATDQQIQGLSKSVRELAFGSGKSFNEVKDGLDSLVAGGLDLDKAMPAMPAIAKTAQAAGAEIKDMATTALALNQGLGISTDKMQASFDVLVAGGKAGKFELKDMSRYMASIIPAATAVGMTGEDGLKRIVAMMQTVRAGTGTTEEAAASVQNIFAKMESEETANKFKKMGVDLRKEMAGARKDGKELLTFFTELTEKTLKGDMSKLPQLFSDMEFSRGMRALLNYKDVAQKVMADLNKSAGAANADFDRVMQRPQIAIDRLSESWDRIKTSAGAAIDSMGASKGLQKIAETFEESADYYNKPEAERARIDAEKRRRAVIDPQVREVEQKIEYAERAERSQTEPSLMQQMRGEKLEPLADRLEKSPLLRELRMKLHELKSRQSSKSIDDLPPLFTDKERETIEEVDRERRRGVALSEMKKPTPTKEGKEKWTKDRQPPVPMPMPDPRRRQSDGSAGENNIMDLPDSEPARQRQLPQQTAASSPAVVQQPPQRELPAAPAAPVTAQLTGTGDIAGKVDVTVKVEAGSTLIAIEQSVKNLIAQVTGRFNAGNGPGSLGKSSPDAAAPNVGRGSSGSW